MAVSQTDGHAHRQATASAGRCHLRPTFGVPAIRSTGFPPIAFSLFITGTYAMGTTSSGMPFFH